jgi:hypothetical protein
MKTTLIMAGLAAILLAPLSAEASCAYYGSKGSELPVTYWERFRHEEIVRGLSAANDAILLRILADADLCQRDRISYREYEARIAESAARVGQHSFAPEPMPFSCMSDGFGGFACM